jgi:hypothetical protein
MSFKCFRSCSTGMALVSVLAVLTAHTGVASPGAVPAAQSGEVDTPALGPVNAALPAWLDLSGEFRFRFEGRRGLGFAAGNRDDYALFRTRFNVGLSPASGFRVFLQVQDSRAPGIRPERANGVFRDPLDLRQAWVRLGGEGATPVSLTIGRQLLLFGDQRLVGPLDWTNTSRTWDAVRLGIEPAAGVRFDVFSASVVVADLELRLNRSIDGNNVHGFYGVIERGIPRSTIEPFVFWRTNPSVVGESGPAGDLDRYSGGARIAGSDLNGFDYSATLVRQWGHLAASDISAWAASLNVGYSFAVPGDPRLFVEYNFASGDEGSDGTIEWFDDVYPTAHLYYGYNDLVGWRNIRNLRIGGAAQVSTRLRLSLDYHGFWLANPNDNLYDVAGAIAVASPPGGALDSGVGDEIDVTLTAPVTSTVTVGGGVGFFFPGPFIEAGTEGDSNTFAYLFAGYRF